MQTALIRHSVTNSDGSVPVISKSEVETFGVDLRVFSPAVVVLLVLGVLLFRLFKRICR
jgi:hypothetical protein